MEWVPPRSILIRAMAPILIVDDCDDDVLFFMRSLKRAGLQNKVFSVRSGRDLIRYLTGQNGYADRNKFPLPGMIFLDLKMPEMSGFDVLKWLRESQNFNTIPVVVLTDVMELGAAQGAYRLGAKSFLNKPFSVESILQLGALGTSLSFKSSVLHA
jgi:CheY-like chemotaxis protein